MRSSKIQTIVLPIFIIQVCTIDKTNDNLGRPPKNLPTIESTTGDEFQSKIKCYHIYQCDKEGCANSISGSLERNNHEDIIEYILNAFINMSTRVYN
jgi:hypothetical protein